ncbi:MAG: tRNA delta(2)-isopentenylpyrophosphate transferase, tRNA dimethylallyltransferase [Candidatus Peregrinibacteria bacterium GW2011_GWC2_39_14]|nr:MAG: tRNA dimethylallyltransferase [Candidatus Peregrinibacteria bacterium GW2011_GWA2_38_36]KKR06633.1 MAG: tRNA delta(2)-isopentenylpyrophosphate transferase, tRNA dimethylallyltransferase [Candidatus Peregrinibacteria bacterium GW2011_GWC2_39_14]
MKKAYSEIEKILKKPNPLIVVLGPTASGKTALSLSLAKKYNCEIISADSRQIYKRMTISTDKIQEKDMQGIRHHLIDFVEPDQVYTVAEWKRDAIKVIDDIYKRGKVPMIVGGTGLYISSVIYNYEIPTIPPNSAFRKHLEALAEKYGTLYIYRKLIKVDPKTAKKTLKNNLRYIIRALEINKFSKANKVDKKGKSKFNYALIGINWPREELYKRIDKRVDIQIERGLLEETAKLAKKYDVKLPSMTAIGCKEILPYLNEKQTLESMIQRLKYNTHHYARRQISWFKREKKIVWLKPKDLISLF